MPFACFVVNPVFLFFVLFVSFVVLLSFLFFPPLWFCCLYAVLLPSLTPLSFVVRKGLPLPNQETMNPVRDIRPGTATSGRPSSSATTSEGHWYAGSMA